MKKKRLLALILTIFVALSCVSIPAFAETSERAVTYTKDTTVIAPQTAAKTKVATVTGVTGFTEGEESLIVTPTVVTEATSSALEVSEIYSEFGTGDDANSLYVVTTANTEGNWYYVRLYAKKGEEVCYTYIPFLVGTELDSNTTTKSDIIQKYDVNVGETKTDVTKVQIAWTLPRISASVTKDMIWDPDTLTWINNSDGDNATASAVQATFNFKNLSSIKIHAQVAFEAASGINASPTYTDNNESESGDGKIILNSKALNDDADLTGKVVVNVPADTDYFKSLTASATDVAYGTYTVTISGNASFSYNLTGSEANNKELSSDAFLDTEDDAVSYMYNSKTCYAYNGYISETKNANWDDAQAFVKLLNDNEITPKSAAIKGNGGSWRLLNVTPLNSEDGQKWALASGAGSDYKFSDITNFGNVAGLWSSVEHPQYDTHGYYWNVSYGYSQQMVKTSSDLGFVVIWTQN